MIPTKKNTRSTAALAIGVILLSLAVSAPRLPAADDYGLPAPLAEAAGRMTLPEGFRATLFAGEPDVEQPIAFTIDARGRLWVVECYSYPQWSLDGKGRDRVIILEDTDGDGRMDRRKVFLENGSNLTGIELGFGGVWLCSTPNLLFVPDRDGDDVPDGPPVVALDGWDLKCEHNAFNALRWGPDGWLYGCNGIMSNSRVGTQGTADARRVPINCGVWRYQPERKVFEAVAHGTTNPWGLDFDERGEIFITNCVIPHLYHVVPGAHYIRMYGQDISPHSYGLLESCADHIHWGGGSWTDSRGGKGKHGEAGGGHAHAGCMVYLGDSWPAEYRGSVFISNLHGHRLNRDLLERRGSGYVAHHGKDFLFANDEWFRGLEMKYGPDGSVYVTDWSDAGECHEHDAQGSHRGSGRIYRVAYREPKTWRGDLAKLADVDLVNLQLHPNEWFVRKGRLILQERSAAGKDLAEARRLLREILERNPDPLRRLRALWALFSIGGIEEAEMIALLGAGDEDLRAWAVRLLVDGASAASRAGPPLLKLASREASPRVRLALASAAQRLEIEERVAIGALLAGHGADASDPMLPLMIWYAIEPAVEWNAVGSDFISSCRIPLLLRYLVRREVLRQEDPTRYLERLAKLLAHPRLWLKGEDRGPIRDLLDGAIEGLRHSPPARPPVNWEEARRGLLELRDAGVSERLAHVSLLLGDPEGARELFTALADDGRDPAERRRALEALAERHAAGLSERLPGLLGDPAMRGAALRALARSDDPAAPDAVLAVYPSLGEAERADAVGTLAARPAWARRLLDAVGKGTIPRRDLSAFTVRQLLAFKDPRITAKLAEVWGTVQEASREKVKEIARWKGILTAEHLRGGDAARGRAVFQRTCAPCHRLHGEGGDVGPDLTGSQRENLDYLLENLVDPSRLVGKDYTLRNVFLKDGRLIPAIVKEETPRSLTLQTQNERLVVQRDEVREALATTTSIMPEGILETLVRDGERDEVRDLVSYLRSREPPPVR